MSEHAMQQEVQVDFTVGLSSPTNEDLGAVKSHICDLLRGKVVQSSVVMSAEATAVREEAEIYGNNGTPYTVVFYIDGDRHVETFVQEVFAENPRDAWGKAVQQAREDGGTSSGHSLCDEEYGRATEITTLIGHGLSAYAHERLGSARSKDAVCAKCNSTYKLDVYSKCPECDPAVQP